MGYSANKKQFQSGFEDGSNLQEIQIAENFNQYFSTIGSVLDSQIPQPSAAQNIFSSGSPNPHSFFFFPVSETELDKFISNLKNVKTHRDSMPVKVFKSLRSVLTYPLTKLINNSINNGQYPKQLKLARMVPIFKSGNELNPADNRPISCLPYLGKLYERCVKDRLISFFNKFSIISNSQFGFRKGISTSDALIRLTEIIFKSLNDKKFNLVLLIDLKKAFDTVNHDVLLKKLEFYGIRGLPLKWFESYLTNRHQKVVLSGQSSSLKPLRAEVPQGSILGPFLFVVYTNDMTTDLQSDIH